jgi:hypothetical protein
MWKQGKGIYANLVIEVYVGQGFRKLSKSIKKVEHSFGDFG